MEDKWICKNCGEPRDRNSYVTMVTTVTGQVLKADEDGRVIDVEPKFPIETGQLCYTCYTKKYKDPAEQLEAVKNLYEQFKDVPVTMCEEFWKELKEILEARKTPENRQ